MGEGLSKGMWQEAMRRIVGLIGVCALCLSVALGIPLGSAPGASCSAPSSASGPEAFKRLEEDPLFVRRYGPVISVRLSGESRQQQQITIYHADGLLQVLWTVVGRAAATSKSANEERSLEVQEIKITSEQCPSLPKLVESLETASLSLAVSQSLYFPSVTYQIWSTSPLEARYVRLHRPDATASSVASWGEAKESKLDLQRIIDDLFQYVALCVAKSQE